MSHSARSAWIETPYVVLRGIILSGRTPQGVRGLKQRPVHRNNPVVLVALRKECVD